MKKVISIVAIAALFVTGTAFKVASMQKHVAVIHSSGDYFDVRFENDCDQDVKLRIEADGSASESYVNKHETDTHPLRAGYKVYVDGNLLFTADESDAGKTYVVCK